MSKKYTYEEVKAFIEKDCNVLLSETYKDNKSKLKIMCANGHEYEKSLHDFLKCNRCPVCYKGNREISKEYVINYLKQFGYELVGEYVNTNTKMLIRCPQGHVVDMPFSRFGGKRQCRCRICQHGQKNDYNDVKNYFKNYGYALVGEYLRRDKKLDLICPNGHDIKISLDCFKKGVRCNKCNGSSGEKELVRILDSHNVEYEPQYVLTECRDKQPLPFDFYIPNITTAIEFDGKQHYQPVSVYGGEPAFEICQLHDEIKNEYCKNNGIALLRIPYWDFNNIEQILIDNNIIN